jgi:hypothetical protein
MDTLKKFYGPEEVLDSKGVGMVTGRGEQIIEVTTRRTGTDNDTRVTTTTQKAFDLLSTDESRDWNALQEAKLDLIVKELMAIVTDMGITGGDMNGVLARFGLTLATRLDQAAHIRFEGNSDDFVPGGDVTFPWSLAKAEAIIANSNVSTTETTS